MSWSSKSSGQIRGRARQRGGTLLVAISTITALSVIGGTLALSLTSRSQISSQSASWHEAGAAAESAIDIAVGEVRRVMPEATNVAASPWVGWKTPSPGTIPLPAARELPTCVLTLTPPALVHAGEGSTSTSAVVTVDAPSGTGFPSGWLRLRAVGTAPLPGRRQAQMSKLDVPLRHLAINYERPDIVGRGKRGVSAPQVSRAVEVIVRPVLPFEQAMGSAGALTGTSSTSLIDSFDSSDVAKSTLGLYDSNKRQKNGSTFTLGTTLGFAGKIMGDAGTNGGTLARTAAISGSVNNSFYQAPVPVAVPAWANTATVITKTGNTTINLTAGLSASAPARFKMSSTSGKLDISGDPLLRPTYIEIYATGDISGKLVIDPGVRVAIYAAGNVQYDADDVDNRTYRARGLQVYGVQPASGVTPSINFTLGRDLYAAVYAPGHALQITGPGELIGSLLAKSINITGTMQLHYDEALAASIGPVIDYRVASWIEDVR